MEWLVTFLRRGLPLVALVVACAGCLGGCPKRADCEVACRENGQCTRTRYGATEVQRCYAASNVDCAGSETCRTRGQCFAAEDGTCSVESELTARSCAESTECKLRGACAPKGGFCKADSDAHCRASFDCLTRGVCENVLDGCSAKKAEDCAASTGCMMEGLCDLVPGRFLRSAACGVLPSPAACKASRACATYGRCDPRSASARSTISYCAKANETPPVPCAGAADPVCHPDGLCLRDESNACVRDDAAPREEEVAAIRPSPLRATHDRVTVSPVMKNGDVVLAATAEDPKTEPFPPGARVETTAACLYGDRWYRARTEGPSTRPLHGATRLPKGRPQRCEVALRLQDAPFVEHREWCWTPAATTPGACPAGPPRETRGPEPVTVSNVLSVVTGKELTIGFDEYVNVDLAPAAAVKRRSEPYETSKVRMRWTCRDGWSDEVLDVLDRARFPRGYFYVSSIEAFRFKIDDSDPPPASRSRADHPWMHLRLPCDLAFTFEHEISVPGKPAQRIRTDLFHGCLDRSGVASGACPRAAAR